MDVSTASRLTLAVRELLSATQVAAQLSTPVRGLTLSVDARGDIPIVSIVVAPHASMVELTLVSKIVDE